MTYDLELEKAVEKIQKHKAKLVCVQLPDGLKPKAKEIQQYLQEKTTANVMFWLGSCYGACDIPVELERLQFDLVIQFGHSPWVWAGGKDGLY